MNYMCPKCGTYNVYQMTQEEWYSANDENESITKFYAEPKKMCLDCGPLEYFDEEPSE